MYKEFFPQLLAESEFRLLWTYFTVLDRMLNVKNYKDIEHYHEVKTYLKKNSKRVLANLYFSRNRKITTIVLKMNIHLYRFLSYLQNKKNSFIS